MAYPHESRIRRKSQRVARPWCHPLPSHAPRTGVPRSVARLAPHDWPRARTGPAQRGPTSPQSRPSRRAVRTRPPRVRAGRKNRLSLTSPRPGPEPARQTNHLRHASSQCPRRACHVLERGHWGSGARLGPPRVLGWRPSTVDAAAVLHPPAPPGQADATRGNVQAPGRRRSGRDCLRAPWLGTCPQSPFRPERCSGSADWNWEQAKPVRRRCRFQRPLPAGHPEALHSVVRRSMEELTRLERMPGAGDLGAPGAGLRSRAQ